ncbi:MAG: hypothetical protein RMY34_28135 [Aulosira sp. DedQUE10]|nr:hypothetical protein [Aulosira sp. DedQUE10]
MKPNFEQMSVPELRKYVLEHRDDVEAMRVLFYHPSLKWKTMPPLATADGIQLEENIRIAQEAIAQRVQQENNHQDSS